jgi:hypothetical protein
MRFFLFLCGFAYITKQQRNMNERINVIIKNKEESL